MENEIKVGEYCRTKNGLIAKLIEPQVYEINDKECIEFLEDIVKHSSNLIDLIECGDYVNGKQVSNVDKVDNTNFIEWTDGDMYKTEIENDKFIKTIVTKEMMESISYKV